MLQSTSEKLKHDSLFGRPGTAFTLLVFLSILLVLSASTQFTATTVERFTLEELALRSQTVVQGIVRGSRSYWSPDRRLILTSTTLEVTESLKGRTARTVEVTTVGGQVDDTVLNVSGMPTFTAGENAIVFMERSGAYLTVIGLGQGKFTVSRDQVMNSAAGLIFADGTPSRDTRMSLQEFKETVRRVVERGDRKEPTR